MGRRWSIRRPSRGSKERRPMNSVSSLVYVTITGTSFIAGWPSAYVRSCEPMPLPW